MAGELVIYIAPDLHTGKVRDATRELIDTCDAVAEKCWIGINQVDPTYAPEFIPLRFRGATRLADMKARTTERWFNADDRVWSYLRMFDLGGSPLKTKARIGEMLPLQEPFTSYQDAKGYFSTTRRRLAYLASAEAFDRLGTIKQASYAAVESSVLKRAVVEGVYFGPIC